MKSRLYGTEIDKGRWKIDEIDDKNYHTYKLIDKEEFEIYYLNNIIGVEQVSGDEFLVYRRSSYDYFEIARYKLKDSKQYKMYSKEFSQFHFLDDDKIMFTYWGNVGPYKVDCVYSIKDNKELEEAQWLHTKGVDIFECGILIKDKIYDSVLGDDEIVFTIDPETLRPNSECYSSFRDSYTNIDSIEDYYKFKREETDYINIVSSYYSDQKYKSIAKAKQRVLTKK